MEPFNLAPDGARVKAVHVHVAVGGIHARPEHEVRDRSGGQVHRVQPVEELRHERESRVIVVAPAATEDRASERVDIRVLDGVRLLADNNVVERNACVGAPTFFLTVFQLLANFKFSANFERPVLGCIEAKCCK